MPLFKDRESGLPDPAEAVKAVEAFLQNKRRKQVNREPRPPEFLSEELLAKYLTLEGMARYANEIFERASRNVGKTLSGSPIEIQRRRNTDYWLFVQRITQQAFEMKD